MTSLQNAIINISGAGNSTIITGISGQVIQIISLFMHVSIGNSITLQSGPSTLLTGPMFTAPGVPFYLVPIPGNTYFQTNAGDDFVINMSGLTAQAGGFVTYYQL